MIVRNTIKCSWDDISDIYNKIYKSDPFVYEDYIPEELDDLHEYLRSVQLVCFRHDELSDLENIFTPEIKLLYDSISENTEFIDFSKINPLDIYEYSEYFGSSDYLGIEESYLRFIKNNKQNNDIYIKVYAAEKSKNMPDILKSKIKPIPELPNYPFKIANSIKYSKMNGTKFTIYENEKSNSICNKVFVLSMNLPYEFYSIIHQADSFYCYDFNINQYYFQEFNNLDLDSIFLKSSKNGINSSIWFKLNMGVPRIEKGVRNLLLALHLKLPTIPVVLFSTNEENQLCYRKLTNEMKYKMNEICNPYFIFK